MKKIYIISLLIILQSNISAIAQVGTVFTSKDSEGNKLSYKIISDNTVMLFKDEHDRKKSGTVNVPEFVYYKNRKYTVSEIQDGYFFYSPYCYWEKIVLPNTITELRTEIKRGVEGGEIMTGMFERSKLKSITLPKNLKSIGKMAFRNCEYLEEVIFPQSVTEIGGGCFYFCEKLRYVELPSGIKKIEDAESGVYGFFSYCESLEEVTLPPNITQLGKQCFYRCRSLKKIVIPDNVEKLESYSDYPIYYGCFGECTNLEEIVLSKKIREIDKGCFDGCNKLKKVVGLHHSVTGRDDIIYLKPFLEDFESYKADAVQEVYKWQQKRDFETTAEYRARVTPENQQKKVQEYLAKAIKEYTDKNKIQVTLGQYDADTEIYTLNSNYGTKYVKVPRADAPAFKENFSNATFDASYVMGDDNPVVYDMSIFVNGKSYRTEKTVVENSNYDLAIDLPDINMDLGQSTKVDNAVKPTTIDRTIDESIPTGLMNNTTTFAVIIGNEKYAQVAKVPYAQNDAKIFAEYCKKTLGLPAQNVRSYENVTFGVMLSAVNDIKKISEAYQGNVNVIFYYAGHGVPNETTKDAYLLPADADGRQTEACYPVSRLYKELGEMGAKNVVVFMDACFSGAQRGEGMLAAARGVALKAKSEAPQGNMVVFTAATGDETAYPYNEKGHGMFTYFLLKKLQETKGDCTLGELGEYIQQNVRQQSVVINRKSQTPTITPSANIGDSWKTLKLK